MVMIQDGPQNTGADKPLRITGDPYKVQVRTSIESKKMCVHVKKFKDCRMQIVLNSLLASQGNGFRPNS